MSSDWTVSGQCEAHLHEQQDTALVWSGSSHYSVLFTLVLYTLIVQLVLYTNLLG